MKEIHLQENFKPANIGIVGFGFVGEATKHSLTIRSSGLDSIKHFDVNPDKGGHPFREVIEDSKFIFLAVPTPMREDRDGNWLGIDLSIVEETVGKVAHYTDDTEKIVIIRSTATPGTTERMEKRHPKTKFCFNPEFLMESTYLQDALNPDRIVIGANHGFIQESVYDLYRQRFPEVVIHQVSTSEAEISKYFANIFLATKVALANLFYDLSETAGANFSNIREIVGSDPRIGPSHLGITKERGFGGKCFPKDLAAILGEFKERELDFSVFDEIWKYNLRIRRVQDWKNIPGAVTVDNRGELSGRTSLEVNPAI
jgi:UDPglucose 6-dehydrogenase